MRHCVRCGPRPPKKGGGTAPPTLAHVYCGQTDGWIEMKLGTETGLGRGHIVLDEDPASLPQKRRSPQFSAHVCCREMAKWIKTPLGREVELGPGDIVLDGNPASSPSKKWGHSTPPQF